MKKYFLKDLIKNLEEDSVEKGVNEKSNISSDFEVYGGYVSLEEGVRMFLAAGRLKDSWSQGIKGFMSSCVGYKVVVNGSGQNDYWTQEYFNGRGSKKLYNCLKRFYEEKEE